jgi:hypothetical protein
MNEGEEEEEEEEERQRGIEGGENDGGWMKVGGG